MTDCPTLDRVVTPFVILRDTREQAPWSFQNIRADATDGGRPYLVRTAWRGLGEGMGDYALDGAESEETGWRIAIERKSLADLYGTILSGRERFERELANLDRMEYAAVIVEADWDAVVSYTAPHWIEGRAAEKAQEHRRKSVARSILAWQMPDRFPNVRWWLMPGRRAAEVWCFRILERWWKQNMEKEV